MKLRGFQRYLISLPSHLILICIIWICIQFSLQTMPTNKQLKGLVTHLTSQRTSLQLVRSGSQSYWCNLKQLEKARGILVLGWKERNLDRMISIPCILESSLPQFLLYFPLITAGQEPIIIPSQLEPSGYHVEPQHLWPSCFENYLT